MPLDKTKYIKRDFYTSPITSRVGCIGSKFNFIMGTLLEMFPVPA